RLASLRIRLGCHPFLLDVRDTNPRQRPQDHDTHRSLSGTSPNPCGTNQPRTPPSASNGEAKEVVDHPGERLGGVDVNRSGRSFLAPIELEHEFDTRLAERPVVIGAFSEAAAHRV